MYEKAKNILDINNSFFTFAKKLLWVFVINIIYFLTCIPIITIGASTTAMNSLFMKIINERDFSVLKDYFGSFKENFVKSTVIWIMSLVVGFLLYVDVFYWAKYGIQDGVYGYIMLIVSCAVSVFFILMVHTVFPLIARFDMSIKELVINTVKITARDILYCFEAAVFTVVIIGFTFYMIYTRHFLTMFYMVMICFGLTGMCHAYVYRRVLNKYSEEYTEMVKRVQKEMQQEIDEENI